MDVNVLDRIIATDGKIRWGGILDSDLMTVKSKMGEGVKPLLGKEEERN